MNVRLLPCDSWSSRESIDVLNFPVVFGRSPIVGVQLADRWASRHHCQLDFEDGRLRVRDLESKHGTRVNGQQVHEAVLLPGDTLTIGMTSFTVLYSAAAESAVTAGRHSRDA